MAASHDKQVSEGLGHRTNLRKQKQNYNSKSSPKCVQSTGHAPLLLLLLIFKWYLEQCHTHIQNTDSMALELRVAMGLYVETAATDSYPESLKQFEFQSAPKTIYSPVQIAIQARF